MDEITNVLVGMLERKVLLCCMNGLQEQLIILYGQE